MTGAAQMAESSEYRNVVSCFNKLVTALKQDPVAVANELVSESLIPPADGSIDAQKLAHLLLKKIELSPKRYYDVIKVLSRLDWLADIVDILQTEHGKLDNDSVEVQSPSGKSLRKLSISSGAESPKPGAGAISDVGFKLDLDCPHKQSSLPIPNPVVRFEDLSKRDCKDLFAQMNELTKEIRIEFSKLFNQVYASLDKHPEHIVKHVVLTLTGDGVQSFHGNKKLLGAKSMFDIFRVIQPHCSYFNYDLLKLLVSVHGTSEDKKCFDGYLKSFASYCRAMPCAEEICGSDDSGTDRIKLKFKLEFDRQQLKPNYIKENVISNIARILKIKPSSLYLHRIREGCVCLEFLVPSFLFYRLFPLSDDQMVALYREVNVTSIQYDQPSLHVDIETYAKSLTEERQSGSRFVSDTGSTKNSRASSQSGYFSSQGSSGYFSSGSSMGYSSRIMEHPKRFDHKSFSKRLREVRERDPEWKQLQEEALHHVRERHRLIEEVEQLREKVKYKQSQKDIELKLKIKQQERSLALSTLGKALYQRDQRAQELSREELIQELKTATNHNMKSEIQRRLGETEDLIRWWKELVSEYERQISKRVESLSQLSQESQATLAVPSTLPSKLSSLGEEGRQTDTAVLKTKPSILSPPGAH